MPGMRSRRRTLPRRPPGPSNVSPALTCLADLISMAFPRFAKCKKHWQPEFSHESWLPVPKVCGGAQEHVDCWTDTEQTRSPPTLAATDHGHDEA